MDALVSERYRLTARDWKGRHLKMSWLTCVAALGLCCCFSSHSISWGRSTSYSIDISLTFCGVLTIMATLYGLTIWLISTLQVSSTRETQESTPAGFGMASEIQG